MELNELNLSGITNKINKIIIKHAPEGTALEKELLEAIEIVNEEKKKQTKIRELAFLIANKI